MAFITGPALPSAPTRRSSSTCHVTMNAEQSKNMSRRSLLAGALTAAAAAITLPIKTLAEREYPNVGYLGGSEVIDINNANVRAYLKFKGFYPGLAGLIVSNGPYESVEDLYKLPIDDKQKEALDEYKEQLVALKPTPEYELDKINNGLYR